MLWTLVLVLYFTNSVVPNEIFLCSFQKTQSSPNPLQYIQLWTACHLPHSQTFPAHAGKQEFRDPHWLQAAILCFEMQAWQILTLRYMLLGFHFPIFWRREYCCWFSGEENTAADALFRLSFNSMSEINLDTMAKDQPQAEGINSNKQEFFPLDLQWLPVTTSNLEILCYISMFICAWEPLMPNVFCTT